jgi:hypothetical protein
MTNAVIPHPVAADEATLSSQPAQKPKAWMRLVLTVLAVVVFVPALLDPELGKFGLIPFGLLLAFSTDSAEPGSRRSVILTWRNLGLAAAMVAAFVWFWLWHLDLPEWTLVVIAGALIALPLALQESASHAARERTAAVTKRSLILALCGLVTFAYVYQDRGVWFFGLSAVWVVLPLALAVSWAWSARRGGSSSGGSATRFAERYVPTCYRASTSGCAVGCSGESWPPVARTTHGSGSP